MVIDTSALVAIALKEATRPALLRVIEEATRRIISSVSLLEAGIVLRARAGESAVTALYELAEAWKAEIAPFEQAHAKLGVQAFARFGKGTGHKAQLNFGDCAVYALAAQQGDAILATGRDFAATDAAVARF